MELLPPGTMLLFTVAQPQCSKLDFGQCLSEMAELSTAKINSARAVAQHGRHVRLPLIPVAHDTNRPARDGRYRTVSLTAGNPDRRPLAVLPMADS
jgi:hypothetical protein